jgi:hypothetical protein
MNQLISFSRIVAVVSVLAASPSMAATFTVTNTDDAGAGSLRQAVNDANNAGGDNTIVFDLPGLTQPVIDLKTEGLFLTSNITILNDRPGDVPVTVRAGAPPHFLMACFYTGDGRHVLLAGLTISGPPGASDNQDSGIKSSGGYLTLRNCTLTDNNAFLGGALFNEGGEVTLIDCLVTGNRARQGGGLYNGGGGKLILQHCTISNNSAEEGGGIENSQFADVTLIDCMVSGNLATSTFGDSEGGAGIGNGGSLAMTNCTLSGNQVAHFGGGAISTAGGVTANNCTFVNNKGELGGAIWDSGSTSKRAALNNCTFSGNFMVDPDGITHSSAIYASYLYIKSGTPKLTVNNCTFSSGIPGEPASFDGGAILAGGQHTQVEIANSIFRRTSGGRNIFNGGDSTLISRGHNLCNDDASGDGGTGPGGLLNGPGDIRNTDPMLGPLADNGGPTQTFALLPGSPAINAGDDATARSRDQRGYARNGTSDIGAYEVGGTVPVARLANISTRAKCLRNDRILIAGFIITGSQGKKVMVRAIGPSLVGATHLNNPTLELHDSSGQVVALNDNWVDAPNRQEIIDSTIAPTNDLESAILMTLTPGTYTAVVRGVNNGTGIALAEVYDLDPAVDSKLGNISTRGFVQTGDDVMIGGLIVAGPDRQTVLIRAIGPSLSVESPLADPKLELYDGNGSLIIENADWRSDQEGEILATGIPPSDDLESAIMATFAPGNYTVILRGTDDGTMETTGVAVVEAYGVN